MSRQVRFAVTGRPVRWQRPRQAVGKGGRVHRFSDPDQEEAKREVARIARSAWKGRPATGPVILRVVAIFAIPASWPKALKAEAEAARVLHVADPDLDQLVKLVQDALVGIAYVDDNQVAGYPNSAKRYGSPERTEVTLEEVILPEAHRTPGQRRLEAEISRKGWDRFLADRDASAKRSKTRTDKAQKWR